MLVGQGLLHVLSPCCVCRTTFHLQRFHSGPTTGWWSGFDPWTSLNTLPTCEAAASTEASWWEEFYFPVKTFSSCTDQLLIIQLPVQVLEPRFNVETMALLLNIPPNKTLLRRHLATHFSLLIGSEAQQLKQECLENPDYTLLTATTKVKVITYFQSQGNLLLSATSVFRNKLSLDQLWRQLKEKL